MSSNDPYADPINTIVSSQTSDDSQNNPFDIFSNPQILRAKESLPPNMRAQYEQLGESIWQQMERSQMTISNNSGENVNFTGQNLPPPVEEAAAHISEALKSGMHPSLLDEDEKNLMVKCFGPTWWTKWNYTDDDMNETL
jgi:hypothetical protein